MNHAWLGRPTLMDLNPIELNYCPLIISKDKCKGSCNIADDLSMKICVLSKTKDLNVKVINMIIRIYESQTLVKDISSNCKCKFNSRTCNSNRKWRNNICQCV